MNATNVNEEESCANGKEKDHDRLFSAFGLPARTSAEAFQAFVTSSLPKTDTEAEKSCDERNPLFQQGVFNFHVQTSGGYCLLHSTSKVPPSRFICKAWSRFITKVSSTAHRRPFAPRRHRAGRAREAGPGTVRHVGQRHAQLVAGRRRGLLGLQLAQRRVRLGAPVGQVGQQRERGEGAHAHQAAGEGVRSHLSHVKRAMNGMLMYAPCHVIAPFLRVEQGLLVESSPSRRKGTLIR